MRAVSEQKLQKFYELVDRLRRLPVKSSADATFLRWFMEAMYDIRREAEAKNFQGKMGENPSHTWEEWLEYWEKKVAEFERLIGGRPEIEAFSLSTEQIASFLEIGIRPVPASREYVRGDIAAVFMLVPTFKGEWIRQHAREIKSTWEGSYIPLIVYKSGVAAILVDHKEVGLWEDLRRRIEDILGIPVYVRGD